MGIYQDPGKVLDGLFWPVLVVTVISLAVAFAILAFAMLAYYVA